MTTPRPVAPAALPPGLRARPWTMAGAVLLPIFVLWLAAFHEPLWSMVEIWQRSDTFGHGFLIAPICLYLAWQRRPLLARQVPVPALWALPAVAAAALLWLVAKLADVLVVQEFAALFVLQAAVLVVLGWRVFLTLIFPLGYLLLMVPFGEFLVPPLQDITVFFVVNALRIVGIPVYSDGVFLQIPNGNFTVAEACAGLRFLVATFALALLFASMAYRDWWRRGVFMVLAIAIPIVANGFRALGIVLLAHYTNNEVAVGADHIIYGWIFLTIVTLLLLGAGMALRAKTERPEPAIAVSTVLPQPRRMLAAAVLVGLLVAAGPAVAGLLLGAFHPGSAQLELPPVAAPWAVTAAGDWAPSFQGATAEVQQRYSDGARAVDIYVAYYARQSQDAEVINPVNRIAADPDWSRAADQSIELEVGGQRISATATRIFGPGGRKRVVVSWYWVGGEMVSDPVRAKLLQLKGLVTGQPEAAAILLSTEEAEEGGQGLAVLREFAAGLGPLGPMLEKAVP